MWDEVAVGVYSAGALVGGPVALATVGDLSVGEAALVSMASAAGVLTMGLGVSMVGGGALMVVLSPFALLESPEAMGEMAGAGALLMAAGFGLTLLSPLVFGLTTKAVDGELGDKPEAIVAVSLFSTVGAVAGAYAGFLVADVVLDGDDNTMLYVLSATATSLLFANLSYLGVRAIFDDEDEAPPGQDKPAFFLSTPAIAF